MLLYHCRLTFHDNLFYETRTLGRLYETGRLLHNIALCYAMGLATTTFHHASYAPSYAEELQGLNEAGVYVTPAGGEDVRYVVQTFKLGEERSSVFMEQRNDNIPSYGRAKEIAVGSRFSFGILSEKKLAFLPRWIRMGLWMSKGRLEIAPPIPLTRQQEPATRTINRYPLNPTDMPDGANLKLFDLVSMRPSNLVENALIEHDDWWVGEIPDVGRLTLPAGLSHRVGRSK